MNSPCGGHGYCDRPVQLHRADRILRRTGPGREHGHAPSVQTLLRSCSRRPRGFLLRPSPTACQAARRYEAVRKAES